MGLLWENKPYEYNTHKKNVYQNDTIFYYYVDGDWFNLKKEELKTENFLIYSCEDQEIYDLSSINLAE